MTRVYLRLISQQLTATHRRYLTCDVTTVSQGAAFGAGQAHGGKTQTMQAISSASPSRAGAPLEQPTFVVASSAMTELLAMAERAAESADWPGPDASSGQDQTSRLEEGELGSEIRAHSLQVTEFKAVRRHSGHGCPVGTAAAIW